MSAAQVTEAHCDLRRHRRRHEGGRTMNACPNVITTDEGTSYCALAESSVRALQKERDQYLSELKSIKRGHGQLGRYEQLRLKNAELNAALDWVFANGKIIANDFTSGDRDIYEIKSREELAAAVKSERAGDQSNGGLPASST